MVTIAAIQAHVFFMPPDAHMLRVNNAQQGLTVSGLLCAPGTNPAKNALTTKPLQGSFSVETYDDYVGYEF